MSKYNKINEILGAIEELKRCENITEDDTAIINRIEKTMQTVRNHWVYSELDNLEKQSYEFYRDLIGTVHGETREKPRMMSLANIAGVMGITVPRAMKYTRVCVNRGLITEYRANWYLV